MSDDAAQEPTMEEILASIRRIISDDEKEGAEAGDASADAAGEGDTPAADDKADAGDDILELTDVVNDDGSITNIEEAASPVAAETEPEPAPEPTPEPEIEEIEFDGDIAMEDDTAMDAELNTELDIEPDDGIDIDFDMDTDPAVEAEATPDDADAKLREAAAAALVSDNPAAHTTSAFADLAGAVAASRGTRLGRVNETLEDVVKELLRPMLKEWLDANLPHIVERLVQKEINRLSGRADDK